MSVCTNCQSDKISGLPCGVCGFSEYPSEPSRGDTPRTNLFARAVIVNNSLDIKEWVVDAALSRLLEREANNLAAKLGQSLNERDVLQLRAEQAEKDYQTVKDWAHRVETKLETIVGLCDNHADGAPDATDLGKFCNDMIGLSNEIDLGSVRTLKQQLHQSEAKCAEKNEVLNLVLKRYCHKSDGTDYREL